VFASDSTISLLCCNTTPLSLGLPALHEQP
jgi:hypothetical protein